MLQTNLLFDTFYMKLTPLNIQLLVVPKQKCRSDWKSNKLDFLWNGRSYGHDFVSGCFWLRVDCKKRTLFMKYSFLDKQFGLLDSFGSAPRVPMEMGNRFLGRKSSNPVQ